MNLNWEFNYSTKNCWHFCQEFWKDLTGQDLGNLSPGLVRSQFRAAVEEHHVNFIKLDTPQSPCLVVATRPKLTPHIGIYYQGKVVHAKLTGASYEPLEVFSRGFKTITYYAPKAQCKNSG